MTTKLIATYNPELLIEEGLTDDPTRTANKTIHTINIGTEIMPIIKEIIIARQVQPHSKIIFFFPWKIKELYFSIIIIYRRIFFIDFHLLSFLMPSR